MSEQNNTKEKELKPTAREKEKGAESAAETTKKSIRERVVESITSGNRWLAEKLTGLTAEEAEKINITREVGEVQATRTGEEAEKSIDKTLTPPEETAEAEAKESPVPAQEEIERFEQETISLEEETKEIDAKIGDKRKLQELNRKMAVPEAMNQAIDKDIEKLEAENTLLKEKIAEREPIEKINEKIQELETNKKIGQLPEKMMESIDSDISKLRKQKAKKIRELTTPQIEPAPAAESPAEPEAGPSPETEQVSEKTSAFQQAKLEARFGKEQAEKLKAEYILENQNYKEAIDEIAATFLLPSGKEARQTEAKIVKKITEALGGYFDETPEEQKQGACWEIFQAIKNHITDEAAKTEPKSLKKTLATGAVKGAAYFGAGFGGTLMLGPLGGILIAGGLRQVDAVISHRANKKRLKEYKEAINTEEGKTQLNNTITDLILAKKKSELLRKKLGSKETWAEGQQKDFAKHYKENTLEYLNTHQAEEIEGLTKEQIEKKAECLAAYFAIDDNTEKMLKELETTPDGRENTKWKSLVNAFRKIDNTPSKKFYSAAAATGIGLGIRGAVTTMGMSSKWVRRTMMTFAGYKLGGALGEMAAGKKSPEAAAKKSLENLKTINLAEVTDQTIFNNYSKELATARVAMSEIPQTTENKVQIEKWQRELEKREFELLNETMLQNNDASDEKIAAAAGLIYGGAEKTAKKERTAEASKAKMYKIGGRIGGALLGFVAADASGAIMQDIRERLAGSQKPQAPTEKELEFLKPEEKLGGKQPSRPLPAIEHEIGKAEMPSYDYGYKGGDSVWEESENQLKAALGDKFEGLSTAEKNILIDDVKDSVVRDIGQPESSGYYNKMTENDLKTIDWEKHVRGTIKTAPRTGLITPEIQHPDIPEPAVPEPKGPPSLAVETAISQGNEPLKPKKGFASILERATGKKPKETEALSESLQKIKSGGTDEAVPADLEAPEPAGGPVKVSEIRRDVEKAVVESIKTKQGTQNLAAVLRQEIQIDKQLKEAGINYKEWEKLSPRELSAKLSGLTKPQQKLYKTKTFITIAKDIIAKTKIEQ